MTALAKIETVQQVCYIILNTAKYVLTSDWKLYYTVGFRPPYGGGLTQVSYGIRQRWHTTTCVAGGAAPL